jgi:phosphatidate cytidylyltransferase
MPSPLTIRILSAAVILLSVMGLVYSGLPGIYALIVILGGIGIWEFRYLSGRMGYLAPIWLIYPLGIYFAFSGTVLKSVSVELVLSISLVTGLGAFLFLPGRRQGLGRWAMGLAGAIYVGVPFNYYLLLYTSKPERGLAWVVFIILAVVVSDAAALLVGSRLGRVPFFANISPKKTVEGAVAGLAAAVLVMLIGGFGVLGLPATHAVVLGLLVGASAQLGDLVESQMKRIAGVKDTSQLIPGHGGVLDRIDSVLFPPIVVYLYAAAFQLL